MIETKKADKVDKIYSQTLGVCTQCGKKVPTQIIERNGKIYLEKLCTDCGISHDLTCSDAEWYRESLFYVKPGQNPLDRSVKDFKGCPDSCGLCPQHKQHTCLPVIEILSACDLDCPICLKKFGSPLQISLEEFGRIIDRLEECEGPVSVINLSGGEPTLHPQFAEMLRLSQAKGVMQTTVSTNGLAFLRDPGLTKLFRETEAIAALQFDGFEPDTYRFLRGRDLSQEKLQIVELLEREGVKYSLTATVVNGVNDHEITKIVDFFFNGKAVSLMFQPAAFTGSAKELQTDAERATIPDVVKQIEKSQHVKAGDFNPLPCSHYSCFALSYYLILDEEEKTFMSLKEFMGQDDFLDVIANRTLPGLDAGGYTKIKEKIYEFWSAADSSSSSDQVLKRIKSILKEISSSEFTPKKAFTLGSSAMKAIFIHQFMDAATLDFGRLIKCCNQYPQVDGRLMPMCAQNVFFQ